MKKILLTSLLTLISFTSVFACWFAVQNINNAYIAGFNFYTSHYEQKDVLTVGIQNLEFINNKKASLPLTLWFRILPRTFTVNGETKQMNIIRSYLFYKIVPLSNGTYNYQDPTCKWRLAKSIDMTGKKWKLNFNVFVKLFGNDTLTLRMIQEKGGSIKKGDKIILAWYIQDESGLINAKKIEDNNHEPVMNLENNIIKGDVVLGGSSYDYRGPYVISVIYNGTKTLGR